MPPTPSVTLLANSGCFTCLGLSMADALWLSLWDSISQEVDAMACGLNELVTVDNFIVSSAASPTAFDLPVLVSTASSFDVNSSPTLTALGLGALQTVGLDFKVNACTALLSLQLPALTTIGGTLRANGCSVMASFSAPNWLPTNGTVINFSGNALNAVSVNHVLARCVANAAYVSGNVNLTGGSNAAPTGQGITDKATLITRGVTCTTN